jgi:hypothetical protein
VEEAILGGVDFFVRSGCGVYDYFHLMMFGQLDRRWKVWFFFRNDIDAPIPMFTGSASSPNPTGVWCDQ